ncbi:hypothetical protein BJP65_02430 [Microbacterium sp. BH-3-3-3]|nr:hypothetical protein BJP65_02430 [Microbacterium sp. BH-3-3-3]
MKGRPQNAQGLERTSGRDMPTSSQDPTVHPGGLRLHTGTVRAIPARDDDGPWSGVGMNSTPDHSHDDTADQPDELETADAPEIPDTTDGDDAPVDNPSGG